MYWDHIVGKRHFIVMYRLLIRILKCTYTLAIFDQENKLCVFRFDIRVNWTVIKFKGYSTYIIILCVQHYNTRTTGRRTGTWLQSGHNKSTPRAATDRVPTRILCLRAAYYNTLLLGIIILYTHYYNINKL